MIKKEKNYNDEKILAMLLLAAILTVFCANAFAATT